MGSPTLRAAGIRAVLTIMGASIELARPAAGDIHLEDLAHALAHLCRFGGHVSRFHSVAEHCLTVAAIAEAQDDTHALVLAALCHDAALGYTGEITPQFIDLLGPRFGEVTARVDTVIAAAGFDVARLSDARITDASAVAGRLEAGYLCPHPSWDWAGRHGGVLPDPLAGVPWVGGMAPEPARRAC